ncbi:hypothetical protein FHX46_004418 [Amycolatopsis viridis]|uniref:Secreted protein n=2 Tax=Amycolatopsis viridis TaxID=185678 RepID=A0ABX0SY40_9PSEU|nr:hypothetical protein [Amycolatopsis viridis]
MKLRGTLLAAGAITATATAVLATTGAAAATTYTPPGGWDHTWSTPDHSATVYVEEHGDVIKLCDTKANGNSAQVLVFQHGWRKAWWTAKGNGTCVMHRASEGDPYDLDEVETKLYFHGAETEADTIRSFSNDH